MSFRCLYRRKKLWGIVFAALLLLGLIGCGQGKPADPPAEKHPLEGAQSLKIVVWDNGLVEVHSDTLDEPKRIVPDRLEEELSPLLGETLPSTIKAFVFTDCTFNQNSDLMQRVIAMVKEIPADAEVGVGVNFPWPERLTGRKVELGDYCDLNKVFTETYPRIKELHLAGCQNVTGRSIGNACPNLEKLTLIVGNLQGWDQPMPKVKQAFFSRCVGLSFALLEEYFPSLTKLGLGYQTFPEDLSKISQTGIKEVIITMADVWELEAWDSLEDRYDDRGGYYDLSVEADREALCVLLPYTAQEIAEYCIDQGVQVHLGFYHTS